MAYGWRGHISRSADGVAGILADDLGNTIALMGTRSGSEYALVGVPGPMPEWLALPGDDGYQPEFEGWP